MDSLNFEVREVRDADPGVEKLLAAHHAAMRAQSPEESCHVMTGDALRAEGARIFAVSDMDGAILAIGAYKRLSNDEAPAMLMGRTPVVELKSMHVAAKQRGRRLGHHLLQALLAAAQQEGAGGACLETGTASDFDAARALYRAQGFEECPPFGAYQTDPLSVFMARRL